MKKTCPLEIKRIHTNLKILRPSWAKSPPKVQRFGGGGYLELKRALSSIVKKNYTVRYDVIRNSQKLKSEWKLVLFFKINDNISTS